MSWKGKIILAGAALLAVVAAGLWMRSSRRQGPVRFYTDGASVIVGADESAVRTVVWTEPVKIGPPVDGAGEEREPWLSADGGELYFVRTTARGDTDIFVSRLVRETGAGATSAPSPAFLKVSGDTLAAGFRWGEPEAVGAVNTERNEGRPVLSADGMTLVFASDRAGGAGGQDLWMTKRGEKGWGAAENMGPAVNSASDETGGTISPDGVLLVLASNRGGESQVAETQPGAATRAEAAAEDETARDQGRYSLYQCVMGPGGISQAQRMDSLSAGEGEWSPGFSPAGDFLYFTRGCEAGKEPDIWRARVRREGWGAAERAGTPVNSVEGEMDASPALGGFALVFRIEHVERKAEEGAGWDGRSRKAERRGELVIATSREVYLHELPGEPMVDWAALQPLILPTAMWLAALVLLVLLILLVRSKRFKTLSLLARCLLVSVLVHSVVMFLMTFWQVTAGVTQALGKRGQVQVSLAGMRLSGSAAEQVMGIISEGLLAEAQAPQMTAKADTRERVPAPDPVGISSRKASDAPRQVQPMILAREVATGGLEESEAGWEERGPRSDMRVEQRAEAEAGARMPAAVQVQLAEEAGTDMKPVDAARASRAAGSATAKTVKAVEAARPAAEAPRSAEVRVAARGVNTPSSEGVSEAREKLEIGNWAPGRAVEAPGSEELAATATPASVGSSPEAMQEKGMEAAGEITAPTAGYASGAAGVPRRVAAAVPGRVAVDSPRESAVDIGAAEGAVAAIVPRVGDSQAAMWEPGLPSLMKAAVEVPAMVRGGEDGVALPRAVAASTAQGGGEEPVVGEGTGVAAIGNAGHASGRAAGTGLTEIGLAKVEIASGAVEAPVKAGGAAGRAEVREASAAAPGGWKPASQVAAEIAGNDARATELLTVAIPAGEAEMKMGGGPERRAVEETGLESAPVMGQAERTITGGRGDREAPTVELHQPMPAAASVDVPLSIPGAGEVVEAAEQRRGAEGAIEATGVGPARERAQELAMLEPMAADVKAPVIEQPPANVYVNREPERREEVLKQMGGSEETERAVKLALGWLAEHQSPDGRWDSDHFDDECGRCGNPSSFDADNAITGLAVMCFLAADHTHVKEGPYQQTVKRGIEWLISRQRETGDTRGGESMYSHGIATIALAELFAMTGDEQLRVPVERGVGFITRALNTTEGGWRYEPQQAGDTSVMGWQVMALTSAKRAGVEVPGAVLEAARGWMDVVSTPQYPGLYSYQPGQVPSVAMTAEAMFALELLGVSREDARMRGSAEFITRSLPRWSNDPNTYYWYYATLALFHYQGEQWEKWNVAMTRQLVDHQVKEGKAAGSWDPVDKWARIGGRLYQTCVCTLSLEVYYRYLPMYIVEDREGAGGE